MAKIIPTLDLNKNPQNVENNSLVFAKNIKLLADGTISADDALQSGFVTKVSAGHTGSSSTSPTNPQPWDGEPCGDIIGHIVGINNKIYYFTTHDFITESTPVATGSSEELTKYYGTPAERGTRLQISTITKSTSTGNVDEHPSVAPIVGANDKFKTFYQIWEYNELTKEVKEVPCNFTWFGGKITGIVTVNNTNEEILTISEYFDDSATNINVPIRYINLAECSFLDDESIYTNNPNIPFINLDFIDYYTKTIPNGVYQFFVRYRIRDDVYTDWFPASKELYTGKIKEVSTVQGSILYNDLHKDSSSSFILKTEILFDELNTIYKDFQVGFIVSNDNGNYAKSWKHFNFGVNTIYFEITEGSIKDENIDDFLKTTYEIFNVKNLISYKNRLYISNYKETEFDKNLLDIASNIGITIQTKTIQAINNDYINRLLAGKNQYSIDGVNTWLFDSINNIQFRNYFLDNTYFITNRGDVVTGNEITCTEYEDNLKIDGVPVDSQEVGGLVIEQDKNYREYNKYILARVTGFDNLGNEYLILKESDETYLSTDNTIKSGDERNTRILNKTSPDDICAQVEAKMRTWRYGNCIGITETGDAVYMKVYNLNTPSDQDPYASPIYKDIVSYKIEYIEHKEIRRQQQNLHNSSPIDIFKIFDYEVTWETVYHSKRKYTITKNFSFISKLIARASDIKRTYYNSLMPFTNYEFYVHFVKKNGVATNGYYIGTKSKSSVTGGSDYDTDKIVIYYPKFTIPSTINIPSEFVACYISVCKTGNDVAQCFNNIEETSAEEPSTPTHETYDCLELDTMLYNLYDNISIIDNEGNLVCKKGKYYPSGSTDDLSRFNTAGHVAYAIADIESDYSSTGVVGSNRWIVVNKSEIENLEKQLIKLTPYIKIDNLSSNLIINNYNSFNIPGYICSVKKLSRAYSDKLFVSGTDIYDYSNTSGDIVLEETAEEDVNFNPSTSYWIHSNFNILYLSLTNDIIPKEKVFTQNQQAITKFVFSVDTLISSYIYELKSMYKDYVRKYYSVYDNKKISRFDNTVRVSNVDVDELYRNIYEFDAEDYYNVPTSRGIIINLFAINNSIYVHCEHGLFKFTDSSMMKVGENLYTSGQSIGLKESNPFDIGIAEVFDAKYGYAGLQKKEHSIITYNSYIFYDKLAKTIYAYGGEGQIQPISDKIKKVIQWFNPIDVLFAEDSYNNRFYINLKNEVGNICLSFSFYSNSFVSIHDLDFSESYSSRINPYFDVDSTESGITHREVFTIDRDNILDYKHCKRISALILPDCDNQYEISSTKVASCVDIICNEGYEIVKVLDYINYILGEKVGYELVADEKETIDTSYTINTLYTTVAAATSAGVTIENNDVFKYENDRYYKAAIDGEDNITWLDVTDDIVYPNRVDDTIINVAEEPSKLFCGSKIRIYSDQTASALVDIENTIQDGERPISGSIWGYTDRQVPRYNNGIWSFNNFRDVLAKGTESDTQSLIYGKYFVVRIIIKDKNFKLENMKFNYKQYK